MDKNTVWAIVLSTLVIIGFSYYQVTTMEPIIPEPQIAETSTVTNQTDETTQTNNEVAKPSTTTPEKFSAESESNLKEEHIVISNDVFTVTLTNKGGDIISYELNNHLVGDEKVQMAENITAQNRALALSFGGADNSIINDIFSVEKKGSNIVEFSKIFVSQENADEFFELKKIYTFDKEEYLFRLDIQINGNNNMISNSDIAYTLRSTPQIGPTYNAKKDKYEYRTFNFYNGKNKSKRIGNDDIKVWDNGYQWAGVAGTYFSQQIYTPDASKMKDAVYTTVGNVDNFANAQLMLQRAGTNQSSIQDTYYVYMGPKVDKELVKYNKAEENNWNLSNLRLDEILSSGMLAWLEIFLKWLMEIFYMLIPNWGVSIIIMTIVLKIVLYPLTKKSSMATLKMQEFQPKIKEIQDKYSNNKEKLNMEMAKFYKEAGYNPMAGCFPLLIQFPLIFAMFNLFKNYFEFRGAMFIPGWIPDLSRPDSVGLFPEWLPFVGGDALSILPVIYVASQILFTKITQANATNQNNSMKYMMYAMPVFFFFMFYNAPSGLLLYWTVSNVLQLVQQLAINKMMHAKRKELGLVQDKPKAKEVALPPKAKKQNKK